jgi:hypothetical protein
MILTAVDVVAYISNVLGVFYSACKLMGKRDKTLPMHIK